MPGQPRELVLQQREHITEKFLRQVDALQDFAAYKPHLAQRGAAVEARAFVEKAVVVNKTLRERGLIMGKHMDDFESVLGCSGERGVWPRLAQNTRGAGKIYQDER